MNRGLRLAFDINTFLTFMAFILLVLRPTLLPAAVGVHVDKSGYFMGYMLGAAEWGLAAMTFFGRKLTDVAALRVISIACIVFHVSSAAVMVSTFFNGGSDFALGLWVNVLIPRGGISLLCAYFGLFKTSASYGTVK
ncbi:hypothetical protein [Bradyrhizobium sp. Gha]|uniref:hypothetical protein n=1 Tax=Bradyrhizobium sp. Gha TaxID=1855318 RepID=UPI0008EA51BD|nr:hypothetical protein [Bradyrhizobium sp. Gha]SFH65814.1 hypothetical protein SAMN05216525_101114 [Bradyrhizobium sp. Gha]